MTISKLFDLTGETAIVTGGANGICKATAMRLENMVPIYLLVVII